MSGHPVQVLVGHCQDGPGGHPVRTGRFAVSRTVKAEFMRPSSRELCIFLHRFPLPVFYREVIIIPHDGTHGQVVGTGRLALVAADAAGQAAECLFVIIQQGSLLLCESLSR